ncbi:PP2C family protein-serine/threonine phosphatase [Streptomyces sp. NPDC085466]|uniref:PP2C family protein-serine/threonine phosphatase n=1 Tax=Streptomyces sp. NPDC085466 TaxID=3365725 RepID=UPI0037D20D10
MAESAEGAETAERDEPERRLSSALEAAIGLIGTTLDEAVTCHELTAFLARHPGGTATVALTPGTTENAAPDTTPAAPQPAAPQPLAPQPTSRPDTPERSTPGPPDVTREAPPGPGVTQEAAAGPGAAQPATAGADVTGPDADPAAHPEAGQAAIPAADPDTDLYAGPAAPLAADGRPEAVHTLTAPLAVDRERPLGTVTVVRAAPPYTDADRAVVRQAARLAARHIRHARQLAATEDVALHLQRALVAEPGRPHPNLEIAGRYLPAGPRTLVGGDWFETVRLHFGRSLLVVGDVMGHGLDAAVDMNAYRSALREVAATDLPPHRVLRHLDAVVAEDSGRRPATCLLVRVDPGRGAATFASAGHLPPVVFGPDGSAELVDLPVGPPLGTGVGGYEPATRELGQGDTLLLFTDGLVERRGEDIDVSLARLAGLRLAPEPGPEQVVAEVLGRLDAHHAEDDVAVLAARVRTRPSG